MISSSDNGLIVIYDYANQQLFREFNTKLVSINEPKSLLLMKGDRFLVIADESGVTVLDIETS